MIAFIVGLGLDISLVSSPSPPHLVGTKIIPPEWVWLNQFTSTIKLSDCFVKRVPLPSDLKQQLQQRDIPVTLDPNEKYQPTVIKIITIYVIII